MGGIKLGESNSYKDSYDKSLLEPIPRARSREELTPTERSFLGWDVWNAYELSWLAPSGVPQQAIAQFSVSAASINIVESKSFKYYLNSFNQTVFSSIDSVINRLSADLSEVAAGEVRVKLFDLEDEFTIQRSIPGRCIDQVPCEISVYQPSAKLLSFDAQIDVENEQLYSHVLKSNCPVTGQPDWATVWLSYTGKALKEVSLLQYLVAFRQYQGFHESCVERIFNDIMTMGEVVELSVFARYTRRGGLDINPYRTNQPDKVNLLPFGRTVRQ